MTLRFRFSYRFLFLVVLAGAASFMLVMLANDGGGVRQRSVRKSSDDVGTMRHVASVANVDGNVDKASKGARGGRDDTVVGSDDGDSGNSTKVIDPELKEAMIRLGKFEEWRLAGSEQRFWIRMA